MEFIGLFVAGVLFFTLSGAISCVYGGVAWLILDSRKGGHRKVLRIATCLPPVFAVYMVVCAIVFAQFIPGEGNRIFFGDIYEPLPNGYTLTAMAKMPTYGTIHASSAMIGTLGSVGRVAVDGPFVFGEHNDKQGYFAFDTRNASTVNLDTITELDHYAGHPVQLTEIFSFRSSEGRRDRLTTIERRIWHGPPLICSFLYFAFLVKLRLRDEDGR